MSNKNTTPATINPDANAPEITARGQKLIDKYFTAVSKAKKSAWSVVKVVADTITSESFERDFGSIRTYAAAIDMSPSSLSLMHRAYVLYVNNPELLADFSYTAVAAMLALPENVSTEQLIKEHGLTGRSSVKDVKEAINSYKTIETEEDAPAENPSNDKASDNADEVTIDMESGEVTENGEVVEMISIPAKDDMLYIGGQLWTLSADDVTAIREVLGL